MNTAQNNSMHDSFLMNILETMPSAVLVTDSRLRITVANQSAVAVFGGRELLGKLLLEVIPLQELWSAESEQCLNAVNGVNREVLVEGGSGLMIPIYCSASVLRESDGTTLGMVCVATDLSHRKTLERQLLQSQKLESVGQLAAGIAHEINTPIQYVRDNTLFLRTEFENIRTLLEGYRQVSATLDPRIEEMHALAGTLDLDYLLDEIPRALSQSLEGVEAVAKIVRAMRDFSHPGSDERVKTDINQSIESTVSVCRNEWKYVADLELQLDPELPSVSCFVGEINQVLLNLVVNAAHAIGDTTQGGKKGKGKICISTSASEKFVTILIRDSGSGIPAEIQEKVFDPFFTTKKLGQGSGQGLAICYNTVVEKHRGKLDFESVMGEGTTFRVQLPIG